MFLEWEAGSCSRKWQIGLLHLFCRFLREFPVSVSLSSEKNIPSKNGKCLTMKESPQILLSFNTVHGFLHNQNYRIIGCPFKKFGTLLTLTWHLKTCHLKKKWIFQPLTLDWFSWWKKCSLNITRATTWSNFSSTPGCVPRKTDHEGTPNKQFKLTLGETPVFHVIPWNHPIETTTQNCLFTVPGAH